MFGTVCFHFFFFFTLRNFCVASLSQIREVIQVILFFFLIIFQGALNQIHDIQIALYRGRTAYPETGKLEVSYMWVYKTGP